MLKNSCIWDEFTNQYSLSKTLRFGLIPVGKTSENIKNKKNAEGLNLICQDERLAEDYKKVKDIIDEYHKEFIEKALSQIKFKKEDLEAFYEVYEKIKRVKKVKKDKKEKELESSRKELYEKQKQFREQIRKQIERVDNFKDLFDKNLINRLIPSWLEKKNDSESKIALIKKFEKWTTYFKGFHENRKTVYSADEIPTSIIYRIVNDNLPKFLDNISKFNKPKAYAKEGLDFGTIEEDLKEELESKKVEEIFSLEYFNNCLNQTGINRFNSIIGGKAAEGEKEKRKGVNEYINLFSQKKGDKTIRSSKMTRLFNQILSDRESASFVLEKFENDKKVIDEIKGFYEKLCKNDVFKSVEKLLKELKENNLEQVYVKNDKSLTDISQFVFKDYSYVENALRYYCEEARFPFKNKEKPTQKEIKVIDDYIKKTKYFSIFELEESIRKYDETLDEKRAQEKNMVCHYFSDFKKSIQNKEVDILGDVKESYKEVKEILEREYSENKKDLIKRSCEEDVGKIKSFLDSIQNILNFVKPLYVSLRKVDEEKQADVYEKDSGFYEEFDKNFESLGIIISLYNKVRNYITQKPYSVEKFKLNFANPTLAGGWDLNKETDNTAILFRRNGLFYLGVMDKEHNRIFRSPKEAETDDCYEKVVYKLLPGASKMLPKVFFSKKNIKYYSPSDEVLRIRNCGTHTKNGTSQEGFPKEEFNLRDCHTMIDFFKDSIDKHEEWRNFDFSFSETKDYKSIDEFYREVENQGYKLSFQKIDKSYVDELVDKGKLYLFKIWSKDFSSSKKEKNKSSRKNLHTLYWNALFDEENLKDVVYKLNGEAELFYRRKSIEDKDRVIHKKNKDIKNKNPIEGKEKSKFDYDLIKDKRFTEDKFLFHCPISLNFKENSNLRVNDEVNSNIKKNLEDVHVLGIDRGERHLAYYTLLDSKGKIVEQGSFNLIVDDDFKRETNYQEKLDNIESNRNEARKNWKKIENIKEMKEGYLSQVVHKIAKLVIERNAIVVFEDLNFGFKKGRFKIEKQVYQKLEKMLIEKLNYLMFKDREDSECGGLLKAYQLTPKFESFQKLRKQSGVIFYVPSFYTSTICPRTGFVNLLYSTHETIEKSIDFFSSFKSIRYNVKKNYFEFEFNYKNFKGTKNPFGDDWIVCSFGERLKIFRDEDKNNKWDTKSVDVTCELKCIFRENSIEFERGEELRDEICNKKEGKFFENLMYQLKLVLQMRNSRINSEEDYFLSCVVDENGEFFDSRDYEKEDNPKFPKDADANGAYNVGLKGLMVLEKIRDLREGKKLDLKIDNKEFFEFVLGKVRGES